MNSDFYDQYLKAFPAPESSSDQDCTPYLGSVPDLFRSFEQISGYHLQLVRPGGSFPEYRPDPTLTNAHYINESDTTESSSVFDSAEDLVENEPARITGILKTSDAPVASEPVRTVARYILRNNEHKVLGTLVLWISDDLRPLLDESSAMKISASIASILEESFSSLLALRDREAELGAMSCQLYLAQRKLFDENIKMDKNGDGTDRGEFTSAGSFAEKFLSGSKETEKCFDVSGPLNEILKKTARLIGCQAVSLYLLDNKTSFLKLRAAWGIPEERFTEPPRPLKGSLADLEALLGNAVILNEGFLTESWNAPECFANALCVPVLSDDSVLGTLWFFSDQKSRFDDRDLALVELSVKYIVTELENILLTREVQNYRKVINENK